MKKIKKSKKPLNVDKILSRFDFDTAFAIESLVFKKDRVYHTKENLIESVKKLLDIFIKDSLHNISSGRIEIKLEDEETNFISISYSPIYTNFFR